MNDWLPQSHHALFDFFRAEIAAERASGWQRVKRVPDTRVWRMLRFSERAEESAALDCLATMACAEHGFILGLPSIGGNQHPFFERLREGVTATNDPEVTYGVPLLRAVVQTVKMNAARGITALSVPQAIVDRALAVRSMKAPGLRKAVKTALGQAGLLTRVEKKGGGDYMYHCAEGESLFRLSIDYGGSYAQLRYGVTPLDLPADPRTRMLRPLHMESAFAIGRGDWDYITEENATASMGLLVECVRYCVALPTRIRKACGS